MPMAACCWSESDTVIEPAAVMRLIGEAGRERGRDGGCSGCGGLDGTMNGLEVSQGVLLLDLLDLDLDMALGRVCSRRGGVDMDALLSAVSSDGVNGVLTSERARFRTGAFGAIGRS